MTWDQAVIWLIMLAVVAIIVGVGGLWYSNHLAKEYEKRMAEYLKIVNKALEKKNKEQPDEWMGGPYYGGRPYSD